MRKLYFLGSAVLLAALILPTRGSSRSDEGRRFMPHRFAPVRSFRPHGRGEFQAPRVTLERAPELFFPSNTDSNSPSFWADATLHLLNSNQNPVISSGPDLENLGSTKRSEFTDGLPLLRWIEGVYRDPHGVVWGLYHREDYKNLCADRPYFTIPRIGIAKSTDDGQHWQDLGLVLADADIDDACELTPNRFFAGGVGDPSWAIDEHAGFAYILYSSYARELEQQGVQMARLPLKDLEQPVNKVWRWTGRSWSGQGLNGRGVGILVPAQSWHGPDADAFWGPSVHWNTYLDAHVILLNRTRGPQFEQEGAYILFAPDLADPSSWTQPEKFMDGGDWYVQVVGDTVGRGTDSIAGKSARFFMHGRSEFRIRFDR